MNERRKEWNNDAILVSLGKTTPFLLLLSLITQKYIEYLLCAKDCARCHWMSITMYNKQAVEN